MRALTVCVLLCSAVVLTSAVKPGPAMFADWLEEQTTAAAPSSTAKLAAAPAYDEADYEWGCLREKRVENCRCIGCLDACGVATDANPTPNCTAVALAEQPTCCATSYGESVLACCEKKDYDNYGRQDIPSLLSDMEIGRCESTIFNFPEGGAVPVSGSSTAFKIATFTSICNIHHGEQCGHPFCDSMILTRQGTIYEVNDAVSKTNNTATPKDSSCDGPEPGNRRKFGRSRGSLASKPRSLKVKKSDAAEPEYYRNEAPYHREEYSGPDYSTPTTYYKGTALIWSGPATITSRKYNIKYRSGHIDYVADWVGVTSIPAAETHASMHQVQPYKYILKFRKEDHY